ncbi:MAG: MtnX-like HAD-IB family phosphatase [Pseudomonadota bacterium]|nr:MtnX-like HAD-IB family phosphatase [Pseudomonadota bacterium]MDE3037528.1 MtnX-like HAD-IB family phosphatase [Pseudomonadota bacterium]
MELNILCDFDGTIALQDTTDMVLSAYAHPDWEYIEEEWKAGKIGSAECMQRQIELLDATPSEIGALLDNVEIDPYFSHFVHFCRQHDLPLLIVSDGVDYFIRYVLARYGLGHLPIRSNHLLSRDEKHYTLTFPHAAAGCRSRSGTCKCALAGHSAATVLVGDGRSDFCLAHEANLTLAKKNLLDYCRRHALRHMAFDNFSDVRAVISTLIGTPDYAPPAQVDTLSIAI